MPIIYAWEKIKQEDPRALGLSPDFEFEPVDQEEMLFKDFLYLELWVAP